MIARLSGCKSKWLMVMSGNLAAVAGDGGGEA